MATPRKEWMARFQAHMAEWLKTHPMPNRRDSYRAGESIEDFKARREVWGRANEAEKSRWQKENPPPPFTEEEEAEHRQLRTLNTRLGGGK